MNKLVSYVIESILATASSYVAILVAVPLETAIDARQQAEAPEVKLALVDEQRIVDVLLNDKGAVAIFLHRSANYRLHLLNSLDNGDALASIRILTRLDDPGVLRRSVLLPNLLYRLFILIRLRLASVLLLLGLTCLFRSLLCIFSLKLVLLDGLTGLPLRVFVVRLDLVIVLGELVEFWIVDAERGMKGERQYLEGILAQRLVVLAHVHEEALFVRQLLVLLQLVVQAERKHYFFKLRRCRSLGLLRVK